MGQPLPLDLVKEGDVVTAASPGVMKLALDLEKPAKFYIELWWDSEHDLDFHMLMLDANGKLVGGYAGILSYVVVKRVVNGRTVGKFDPNPDGSFQTPCGSLKHSPDSRTGIGVAIDERGDVDGSKLPPGVEQLAIFVDIYPGGSATFASVKDAGIRIKSESGRTLAECQLTKEYGPFIRVQFGALWCGGGNGWEYVAGGGGLNEPLDVTINRFA